MNTTMGRYRQRIVVLPTSYAILWCTLICFLGPGVDSAGKERSFKSVSDGEFDIGVLGNEVSASSSQRCASICLSKYALCFSFMYNSVNKMCTPGSWVKRKDPPTADSPSIRIYTAARILPVGSPFVPYARGSSIYYIYLSSNKLNWGDSRQACADLSTNLYTFPTVEKFDLLKNITAGMSEDVWIGLDDYQTPDTYRWVDTGEPVSSAMASIIWGSGEPDIGAPQHCCSYVGYRQNLDDWHCNDPFKFACELPPTTS